MLSSDFRLGTYNVLIPRVDTADKGLTSWLSRREELVETIDGSFDLIGLQECSFYDVHEQGKYIVNSLESRGWNVYLPQSTGQFTDEFHKRIPIAWRPGKFNYRSGGNLLLSGWTTDELIRVPTLENRYGTYVHGQLPDGRELVFVNLHLQHTREKASEIEITLTENKRKEAQLSLVEFLKKLPTLELIVIAGDFNSSTIAEPLVDFGLMRISPHSADVENWEFDSFHDWKTPKTTAHLDQIYVSPELIGGKAKITLSTASDHYPVSYALPY